MPSKLIDPAEPADDDLRLGRHQAARLRRHRRGARRAPDARRAAARARATSATTTPTPTRSSTSSRAPASRWSTTPSRSRSAPARPSGSRRPRSTRRSTPAGSRSSLLAIYAPAGAEQALKTLPDYRELPAGRRRRWSRSVRSAGRASRRARRPLVHGVCRPASLPGSGACRLCESAATGSRQRRRSRSSRSPTLPGVAVHGRPRAYRVHA